MLSEWMRSVSDCKILIVMSIVCDIVLFGIKVFVILLVKRSNMNSMIFLYCSWGI